MLLNCVRGHWLAPGLQEVNTGISACSQAEERIPSQLLTVVYTASARMEGRLGYLFMWGCLAARLQQGGLQLVRSGLFSAPSSCLCAALPRAREDWNGCQLLLDKSTP